MIIDMWKEHASGPLHLIHLGFGTGALLLPQIMVHFTSNNLPKSKDSRDVDGCLTGENLTNRVNRTTELTNRINLTTELTTQTAGANAEASNVLQYGYWIFSIVIVIVSLIWFAYGFLERNRVARGSTSVSATLKENLNLNSCVPHRPACAFFLYSVTFVWIFVAVSCELVLGQYLYTYARTVSCWSKAEAANLLTAFWLNFTAGRFIGFVSANFIHMRYIIFVEGIGNAISAIVLFFFSSNRYVLWVCVCTSGLLIGPCYPSTLAWANRYMIVTTTGVAVLNTFCGISNILPLSIAGCFIEYGGMQVIISLLLMLGITFGILPFVMSSAACWLGDRFQSEVPYEEH